MAKIPKSDQSRKQVGITSQRNKWANTDPWTFQRWDQVPVGGVSIPCRPVALRFHGANGHFHGCGGTMFGLLRCFWHLEQPFRFLNRFLATKHNFSSETLFTRTIPGWAEWNISRILYRVRCGIITASRILYRVHCIPHVMQPWLHSIHSIYWSIHGNGYRLHENVFALILQDHFWATCF
jgi:hypothetical protein